MHGEYSTLCEGPNAIAQQYRIAGPGDLDKPDDGCLFLPYWLLNREEMLALILDRSDDNAPNQAARFTEHVRSLKEKVLADSKNENVLATFTVDSPIPYPLNGLIEKLKADNAERVPGKTTDKGGPWFDKLTRFITRMETKISDKRVCDLLSQAHPAAQRALQAYAIEANGVEAVEEEFVTDLQEVAALARWAKAEGASRMTLAVNW